MEAIKKSLEKCRIGYENKENFISILQSDVTITKVQYGYKIRMATPMINFETGKGIETIKLEKDYQVIEFLGLKEG